MGKFVIVFDDGLELCVQANTFSAAKVKAMSIKREQHGAETFRDFQVDIKATSNATKMAKRGCCA